MARPVPAARFEPFRVPDLAAREAPPVSGRRDGLACRGQLPGLADRANRRRSDVLRGRTIREMVTHVCVCFLQVNAWNGALMSLAASRSGRRDQESCSNSNTFPGRPKTCATHPTTSGRSVIGRTRPARIDSPRDPMHRVRPRCGRRFSQGHFRVCGRCHLAERGHWRK